MYQLLLMASNLSSITCFSQLTLADPIWPKLPLGHKQHFTTTAAYGLTAPAFLTTCSQVVIPTSQLLTKGRKF